MRMTPVYNKSLLGYIANAEKVTYGQLSKDFFNGNTTLLDMELDILIGMGCIRIEDDMYCFIQNP